MKWRWITVALALLCGVVAQAIAESRIVPAAPPVLAMPLFALGAVLLVLSADRNTL
jgi:hypothetical protein